MTKLQARAVSRVVKALSLVVLVLATAALAAAVEPAHACSCVQPDPWAILPKADGAFVGRLASRRETDQGRAVLSFSVERAVKGKIGTTVEVTTANNSAACGLEMPVGQRTGLFLVREGGRWFGHMCWQVAPEDLLAAAELPAPNGKGPVALLVGGDFGPARTLALDAQGRTLAYGLGAGTTLLLSPCPGGERLAEIAVNPSELAIRDTRTLPVIRRQRLKLPGPRYPAGMLCEDSAGSSVIIFARGAGDAPNGAAIYRLEGLRLTAIWRGTAYLSSLTARVAYLNSGEHGGRLVSVDLRTGRVTRIAWLPRTSLVPDATGKRLAGVAYRLAERSRVVLIDLTERRAKVRSSPLAAAEVSGDVAWLPTGRFLFLPWYGADTARVFDLTLRTRTRFRWIAGDVALVGSTVFGIRDRGALVAAKLPSGPQRVVRRLPRGVPYVLVSATD